MSDDASARRAWLALGLVFRAALVALDVWLTPRATLARWLWGR